MFVLGFATGEVFFKGDVAIFGGLIRTAPETALKACCTTGMGIDTSSLRIGRSFSPFAGPVDNLRNG
jgi:hypothetical protein